MRTFPAGKEILAATTPDDPEWHRVRKEHVGASDAGPLMGESYAGSNAFTVWESKTRTTEPEHDEFTQRLFARGHALEPLVADIWEEQNPGHLLDTCGIVLSDSNPYMTCTPDRLVDDDAGLEIKTANMFAFRKLDPAEFPRKYYWQVVQSLFVTGLDRWHLIALHPDSWETRSWVLEREDAQVRSDMALLDGVVTDFWESYVQTGLSPEFGMTAPEPVEVDPEGLDLEGTEMAGTALGLLDRRATLVDEIATLGEEKAMIDKALKGLAGNNKQVRLGKQRLWQLVTSNRTTVDSKRLRADYPDVFEKVSKSSTSTSLRVDKHL